MMKRTTATNEDYYQYYKMIHKLAAHYSKRSGATICREELFSVGLTALCEARLKWDPRKGPFGTFLYLKAKNSIITYAVKQSKFIRRCEELDPDIRVESTVESSLNVKQMVNTLTSGAQAVVDILFNCPYELMELAKNSAPKSIRGALSRYLRKLGWKQTTIHSTFNEIRKAVKTL